MMMIDVVVVVVVVVVVIMTMMMTMTMMMICNSMKGRKAYIIIIIPSCKSHSTPIISKSSVTVIKSMPQMLQKNKGGFQTLH
jgi:hypothetical protein